MEVGRVREGVVDPELDIHLTASKNTGPRISQRLHALEQEREELKVTVASLSSQIKEMQELSKMLSGLEKLRQKVDDLADLI